MKIEGSLNRPSSKGSGIRKVVFIIIGFVFSAAGLWYVFHDVDFDKLLASAGRIRVFPLLVAVALYWAVLVVIRSFLVRHLLRPVGHMTIGKAYRYICIGFLANNVLPLRMGEVVRIAGISRVSGIGFASVAGAAAIERLLDMIMAAVVGILAIQVAPLPGSVKTVILITGIGFAVALMVLVFLSRRNIKEIPQTGQRKVKTVVWNLIVRFVAGLGALGTSRGIFRAVAMAVLMWFAVVWIMALRLVAFDLGLSLPVALVLLTGLSLGVALPSAPAYVGVYHAAVVGSLTLFGVDQEVAVGFSIFCHLTDVVPGCLLGVITMFMEGVRLADLRNGSKITTASPK
jgi:uncharacterized protein (TIRG00374 family)